MPRTGLSWTWLTAQDRHGRPADLPRYHHPLFTVHHHRIIHLSAHPHLVFFFPAHRMTYEPSPKNFTPFSVALFLDDTAYTKQRAWIGWEVRISFCFFFFFFEAFNGHCSLSEGAEAGCFFLLVYCLAYGSGGGAGGDPFFLILLFIRLSLSFLPSFFGFGSPAWDRIGPDRTGPGYSDTSGLGGGWERMARFQLMDTVWRGQRVCRRSGPGLGWKRAWFGWIWMGSGGTRCACARLSFSLSLIRAAVDVEWMRGLSGSRAGLGPERLSSQAGRVPGCALCAQNQSGVALRDKPVCLR